MEKPEYLQNEQVLKPSWGRNITKRWIQRFAPLLMATATPMLKSCTTPIHPGPTVGPSAHHPSNHMPHYGHSAHHPLARVPHTHPGPHRWDNIIQVCNPDGSTEDVINKYPTFKRAPEHNPNYLP